jgi:hypothetical protein
MGQILLACEEPHVRAALLGNVIADGAAQHRIANLKRVYDRAERRLALYFQAYLAVDARQ